MREIITVFNTCLVMIAIVCAIMAFGRTSELKFDVIPKLERRMDAVAWTTTRYKNDLQGRFDKMDSFMKKGETVDNSLQAQITSHLNRIYDLEIWRNEHEEAKEAIGYSTEDQDTKDAD